MPTAMMEVVLVVVVAPGVSVMVVVRVMVVVGASRGPGGELRPLALHRHWIRLVMSTQFWPRVRQPLVKIWDSLGISQCTKILLVHILFCFDS